MKFEWDKKKSELNKKKHKITFEYACFVFSDKNSLSIFDENHSDSEERWITIGLIPNGNIIVVIHTYRKNNGDELVRIISARKATNNEIKQYYSFK